MAVRDVEGIVETQMGMKILRDSAEPEEIVARCQREALGEDGKGRAERKTLAGRAEP